MIKNIQESTHQEMAMIFQNQLKLYSKIQNKLFKIKNLLGNEFIIFTFNNNVYIPKCIEVNRIIIEENINICFEDIKVKYEYKNETYQGFLTSENIIREDSQIRSCKNFNTTFLSPSSNKILIRQNNRIKIEESSGIISINLKNHIYDDSSINFQHHDQITNGFDFNELLKINNDDIDGGYYNLPDDNTHSTNDFINDLHEAKEHVSQTINNIRKHISNAFLWTTILITCTTIIITLAILKKYLERKKARRNFKAWKHEWQQ